MDANQLKLYIEQNIKLQEPGIEANPRLALELGYFTEALIRQLDDLDRAPTPDQIGRAWDRWKLERFHYVEHVKTYSVENSQRLQDLAAKRVIETQPDLPNDPQLAHEAHLFKQAYARQLEHLSKQPLPEHIDMAWLAWKRGYRF
jgi:hypothetical protein